MPTRTKRIARKTSAPRRRRTTAVTKRRVKRPRRMSNPFAKATMKSAGKMVVKGAIGGAVAEVVDANLSPTIQAALPSAVAPYASAITLGLAAYATKVYGKQVDVAAGMAGVAGAKLASAFIGTGGVMGASMAGAMSQGINYAMSGAMPLSGYQVPMAEGGVYASDYANQFM